MTWAFAGALAGWLLLLIFDPNGQLADDAVTIVVGGAAGVAINRFVRAD